MVIVNKIQRMDKKHYQTYVKLVGLTDQRLKITAYQNSNGRVSDF